MRACVYALRIVSTDKMLCFRNTLIINYERERDRERERTDRQRQKETETQRERWRQRLH